ncbi:dephospho-CoA kinase [Gemmobacter lutimaris]|uniref:Dephospho-CoA kinase n=1 Tax=Gemmobacter lutimaris TaxID=2306023 RepID=A0A398BK91_9RHOB|nr:dephospho-CoA kinase [Gemmobacter lutimaris]RID90925.1 dephospho-CoA kinase [Gemmobacter lutimaris]
MTLFRLGLTGSIGMGKSTTAGFFRAAGLPVWDADAAVHRLYSAGGAAVAPIGALLPDAVIGGAVSRDRLKQALARDAKLLPKLEHIVHPLVAADREAFAAKTVTDIAVFDIPLLFEKGTETDMDATLLVTAPAALQRARVLARPGMTEAQFALILSRQMPDRDKRARATHIIETLSLPSVESGVTALIAYIRGTRDA